jgi:SAM-dependent methyltransferase
MHKLSTKELDVLKFRKNMFNKNKKWKISDRFTDPTSNLNAWKRFYKNNNIPKDYKILDFGCAVGFSIIAGRELGYNVMGVDVEYEGPYKGVEDFREKYGTTEYIHIYDGHILPFADNSIDVIVGRTSFDKFNTNQRNDSEEAVVEMIFERLDEFKRILTPRGICIANTINFLTPKLFKEKNIKFKIYNFN